MPFNDEEFLRKLLDTFRVEAAEHVAALSSGLVELEGVSSRERQMEIVEIVFRAAHSLKGAARSVNLNKIEAICQSLESAFAEMKAHRVIPSRERFDQLHQMVSAANFEIGATGESTDAGPAEAPLSETQTSGSPPSPRGGSREKPEPSETVRISKLKLASLLGQAEELVAAKSAVAHHATQLLAVAAMMTHWEREWRKVPPLVRALQPHGADGHGNGESAVSHGAKRSRADAAALSDQIERNERAVKSIRGSLSAAIQGLEHDSRGLDRQVSELLDNMKGASMLPFSTLLSGFPKVARDLCRDCGKDAELTIDGGDIEADRRVLEELKDPLTHLIRNCIDHGIELPKHREQTRKPRRATIAIRIAPRNGNGVDVVVSDDGAGIDVERVRAAAVNLRIASPEEIGQMDARQALTLVFQSGLSTSPAITEVSGRGLGLAIVRENVERIGGSAAVESEPGRGTTFRLTLPLTLSSSQGLLLRAEEHLLVLPGIHAQRVIRIGSQQIRRVENREVVEFEHAPVSLARLADVLGAGKRTPAAAEARHAAPGILVTWMGQRMIFLVDEILGVREFIVKSLGPQLVRVRNVSGATLLPTGKIALVLNVADLFRSAGVVVPAPLDRPAAKKTKSILVVEDSITTRALLRGVLESAGYHVRTAFDGIDALTALAEQAPDLVVSDVDMPRMGGFDLTAKIRADGRLSGIPVVLVTALDSRSDRERGMDAGASGYIVKSSFDQSNLLEVVQRLI